jgi:hypothetical protein
LRNFENLPEDLYIQDHNDIDLICDSYENCAYILNAKKVFNEPYRVHYVVSVENKNVYFDLRYIGDNYYDYNLERDIIKTRIYNEKGFYTVNNNLYFYTLLYHAILHKNNFSNEYKDRLIKMNILDIDENTDNKTLEKILEKWLISNEYIIKIPIDKSVLFNRNNAKNMSVLLYREEENLENLKQKINNYEQENNKLKNDIREIINSKGWKITTKIRNIASKLKK